MYIYLLMFVSGGFLQTLKLALNLDYEVTKVVIKKCLTGVYN